MRSSYIENNYGHLLEQYVMMQKPEVCVELGSLDGYSTLHIARGIEYNTHDDVDGRLDSYDLFEDYPYKHGDMNSIRQLLTDHSVSQYVDLIKGDAYKVYENYDFGEIDFLHVDISNTGETVRKIIHLWGHRISERGVICFEGGSDERDHIEWMKKYNMPSINKEIETNETINEDYFYCIYPKFPSMTVLMKKHEDYYGRGW